MKIDGFLSAYNASSALFDRVASNVSSFDAAKNYARAEFSGILDKANKKNAQKNGENSSTLNENGVNLETNSANFHTEGVLNGTKIRYKDERAYDAALREQTDAFEAFLIKSILDVSLTNKVSLFGEDASDEIYRSMYNDAMSRALSGGLGFSELLFNYLKERA